MCVGIYIFVSKKHTQTKKFPLANLFVGIYVFSLETIKDWALCCSTKKCAVRIVFKCKLYLTNSIKLITKNFFRHPHFRKQEFYFFWPENKIYFCSRKKSNVSLNKKVIFVFHTIFKLDFITQIIYCIIHRCLYSLFILFLLSYISF